MRKILFIINSISGTHSKESIPKMIDRLIDKSRFVPKVVFTEYAGHAAILATKAKACGVDIVVAVGGDGTVNEVGRSLVGSQTAMGIIPCGSGNGLARHLQLPMSIRKSLEIINECQIHQLDYGMINDYPFFCTCGMGFDAFISGKFAEAGKRGPVTYLENVLSEGLKYKPETYEIIDDGGVTRKKAYLISCANASQYGNNAYIAPQASMSDGLLDVIIMEPFDLLDAPQISMDLFNKTLDKNSKVKTFRTKSLHIRRRGEGLIHFDGDPVMTGPNIKIHLVEKGIRVIINPMIDRSLRQPNAIQEATNGMMNNLSELRGDMTRQMRIIQAAMRRLQRRIAAKKLI